MRRFDLVTKGNDAFKEVGKSIASRWVDETWKQGGGIRYKKIPGKLSKITLKNLVDTGNLEELNKSINVPLLNFDDLTAVFSKNLSTGKLINQDFSRLTTLKREQYGTRNLPDDWSPKLGQGSIIRKINADDTYNNDFLLCIQPRCDSVRIKKNKGISISNNDFSWNSGKPETVFDHQKPKDSRRGTAKY